MSYTFYFEKTRVWNAAIELAKQVYMICRKLPSDEKFGLNTQLKRASISVSSNIAEGLGRKGGNDQARFTNIAYSSLMEVVSQIRIAKEFGYVTDMEYEGIRDTSEKIANQLNSLRETQINRVNEPKEYYGMKNELEDQSLDSSQLAAYPRFLDSSKIDYFVHPSAIIDPNTKIGKDTKIWHFSHIMSNATIGEKCNIGQNVVISPDVVLGNNVKVQNNVSIYTGVTCEDDVFLGPSMVFTNVINPRSAVNRKKEYLETIVKKGATIGANATIVCGHNIGKYAFIGAGAVVTKEIPDYALVVGNPARQIGWMSEHGERLDFSESGEAVCKGSGDVYVLKNEKVVKI